MSMVWNYRVVKRTVDDYTFFAVYEVYYDDQVDPVAVTETPVYPQGDDLDDLRLDFEMYSQAFNRPVLDWDEIGSNEV